jgi:hypothetical protein
MTDLFMNTHNKENDTCWICTYVLVHRTPSLQHPMGPQLDSWCKSEHKVVSSSPTHPKASKNYYSLQIHEVKCQNGA